MKKKDIVCLTLKTEKDSCVLTIKEKLEERVSKFTTFRKFKGLESNAILVVDIGKEHLFSFFICCNFQGKAVVAFIYTVK